MNVVTKIIFLIFSMFVLNIIFYYLSEDYRFFLKKIKNDDNVIYVDDKKISDEEDVNIIEKVEKTTTTNEKDLTNDTKKEVINSKEIVLGKRYKDILYIFSKYNLVKLDLESNLFDLTDEYPDKYYEYYSPELTLYFFTSKNYEEVRDIMRVLSYELPYKINEVNNFGDKSFYINLNDENKDNNVRLVISNKNITFGLKIKKNSYNEVKNILNKIKSTKKE